MNLPNRVPHPNTALSGWWQLVSCDVEFQSSGAREPLYGTPAHGYIVFAPNGRMMTVVEADRGGPPGRDGDRNPVARGMAYTGRYRAEGDQWFTEVDAASIPGWTGSVQERSFRIESGRLHVCSAWCVSPLHGGQVVRAWLVWERMDDEE